MHNDEWLPLFARQSEEVARELEELHEGIPDWLRKSLWSWLNKSYVQKYISPTTRTSAGYYRASENIIRQIERIARINIGWTTVNPADGESRLRAALYKNPRAFLTAINMALKDVEFTSSRTQELDSILREGSAPGQ